MKRAFKIVAIGLIFVFVFCTAFSITSFGEVGGQCGTNATWALDKDGTLIISGNGAIDDCAVNAAPWYKKRNEINSIIVGNGITKIGRCAFYACSCKNVLLGESVNEIGVWAFGNCNLLTNIVVPDNVTHINCGAFRSCNSLETITLPFVGGSENENNFLGYIFDAWDSAENSTYVPKSLKTVIISNACTKIESYAFYDCKYIKKVLLSDNITIIKENAFYGCQSIENLILPSKLKVIESNAFVDCISLKSVSFKNGLTEIGDYTFENCNLLENFAIPDSVQKLGYGILHRCSRIKHLTTPFIGEDSSSSGTLSYFFAINYYYEDNLTAVPKSIISVTLSDSCKQIPAGAFANTVIERVNIGRNVTSIGDFAFNCCKYLESIVIPKSVTYIGEEAIYKDKLIYCDLDSEAYNYARINGNEFVILPKSIRIFSLLKSDYFVGSALDEESIIIAVYCRDGKVEFYYKNFDVIGFDTKTAGTKTITVNYLSKTATFNINVLEPTSKDLTVAVNILLGKEYANEKYDYSGDGIVDITDFVAMKKQLANL